MIEAKGISYRVGRAVILDGIDIDVPSQCITAVLGPNGSGKSTLLKCLTGILKPDRGNVRMAGKPLTAYALVELARKRAVLMQSHGVSFPFKASEVVMLGRHPYFGSPEANNDGAAARLALERCDAWHLRDRLFPTLSGGEQQRVQLARALAQIQDQENAILFLDEPTSALDLKHQHRIFEILRDLVDTCGLTVCAVLHDLGLAWRYVERAVLLDCGRLHAAGPVADVIDPTNVAQVFDIPKQLADELTPRR